MIAAAKKLETASGIFFFSGFLLSKLQYIPFPTVAAVFRFISLGIYFLAYGSWSVACLLHPDHKKQQNKWYGFAQIKEQLFLSSFIGLLATVLSTAAVFMPVLFPPAAWLFFIGNILCSIGEYHKFKNPPQQNAQRSNTQQQNVFYYATTSAAISLVAAVAATLMLVFPALAIPITLCSLVFYAALGMAAFGYWLKSKVPDHIPGNKNSYAQISDSLGPAIIPKPTNSLEPEFTKAIFSELKEHVPPLSGEIELTTYEYKEREREYGFLIPASSL